MSFRHNVNRVHALFLPNFEYLYVNLCICQPVGNTWLPSAEIFQDGGSANHTEPNHCCNVATGWEGYLANGALGTPYMAKTDKERLATGFWNRIESNQATDCNKHSPQSHYYSTKFGLHENSLPRSPLSFSLRPSGSVLLSVLSNPSRNSYDHHPIGSARQTALEAKKPPP